ncbi:MAG: TetR family transcriptional regulator [Alteraurantiacibacter sp. bin_em_oilr2.035]|uniref:TetR/AcrR family transcriptional regulator n=1 Tax=Aurantiacibacter atlanticus TaxID=1648404 RepID=UPI0007C5D45D|nr:TetR family transcriptional regulator [Aurantiacibacter atlanticus]MDF1833759.1 TetR family transcriptional regulator [Alteraurantiacibacter sp. bin_em_oilr2.035]
MSIKRRLPPEESRAVALEAARALLIDAGPQAVTLKAVASMVGRTHANLLHHFGSASGLQKELARHLARTVCDSIGEAVRATRAGIGSPREVVDLAFDAFGREGGGQLASWMLASGNEDALNPIIESIHALVHDLNPDEAHTGGDLRMHETTFTLVLLALGDALLGEPLAESLTVKRSVARDRAEQMLVAAYQANAASVEAAVVQASPAASVIQSGTASAGMSSTRK